MNINLNYGFKLNESRLVKKHAHEFVATGSPGGGVGPDAGTGGFSVLVDGVKTQVISPTGKILESAGIELSDGDSFDDNNGNEVVSFGVVGSAVNELKITNAATGNAPALSANGDDASINIQIAPKGSGNVKLMSGGILSDTSGAFSPFVLGAAQQDLSGAGAVNVTSYYTTWTTTGADAGTLANGIDPGQLKKIQMIVDGGDGTLTPANLNGGTTITFADVGDFAVLLWDGFGWSAIELGNAVDGATAPVLA